MNSNGMIDLNEETVSKYSSDEVIEHIRKYIDKISKRYTKHYGEVVFADECYL